MRFFYENKGLSILAEYNDRLAFGAHLHNHIELVYMIDGRVKVLVDSLEYVASTGDAIIVFPNQIHQYQKIGRENCFLSIFPRDLCPEFQNIFKYKLPISPVIKNASDNKRILPLIDSIVETHKKKPAYYDNLIKGYFLSLLGELFQEVQFKETKSSDGDTIKAVLNFCSENYTQNIKLETIAQALHISRSYISHLFCEKLHMGFSEYVGTLRISDACKLLASQDMSITEVSYAVGFNSTRSFNRLFLKYTGMTPREYRRKGKQNKS
ncbi:MAG: AraC family transcriptional regulator [Clostridiaceae bacterium]|jgi:AraC-like DNA-binding protein|nr:AraC family transcriptional regulator [Clostridiaceae bacterium]